MEDWTTIKQKRARQKTERKRGQGTRGLKKKGGGRGRIRPRKKGWAGEIQLPQNHNAGDKLLRGSQKNSGHNRIFNRGRKGFKATPKRGVT